MKNVIFDLDGTLALCDHRQHHITGPVKNWDAFFSECDQDTVNEPIATLFRMYRDSDQYRVWIISGRSGTEDTERKTLNWLYNNKLYPTLSGPDNHRVLMRKHGDKRHDVDVKHEFITQHGLTPENTEMVFEDRNSMVAAYRLWGFKCCQVAEGDF